jgi:RNA polymerase sigma factor (sigma-70 family)
MPNPPTPSEASDKELMAAARDGDENAYHEMVRRFGAPVFELIHWMVDDLEQAEDLTHETFINGFHALDRAGPEKKLLAWWLKIAENTALVYIRRACSDSTRSPLPVTPGEIDVQATRMPTPSNAPTDTPDLRESIAAVKHALGRLRPEYRRCFTLYYAEDLSHDEIADTLKAPRGTVSAHLSRARAELKRMLEKGR